MSAFTLAGALARLLDAIAAYDEDDLETSDEFVAAYEWARVVLAQNLQPAPAQEGLDLGGAS